MAEPPTFGVEIEVAGTTKKSAALAVQKALDGEKPVLAGTAFDVYDEDARLWRVVEDGSISHGGAEIVSPVLSSDDDLEKLRQIALALSASSAESSAWSNCAIHVHVGVKDLSPVQIARIGRLWCGIEQILLSLLTERRRLSYASRLPDLTRAFLRKLSNDEDLGVSDLRKVWYVTAGGIGDVTDKYDPSRYHSLNLHSYFYEDPDTGVARRTLEFRIFDGTLDPDRILFYVWLCRTITERGANAQVARASSSEELTSLLASWGKDPREVRRLLRVISPEEEPSVRERLGEQVISLKELRERTRDISQTLFSTSARLSDEERERLTRERGQNQLTIDRLMEDVAGLEALLERSAVVVAPDDLSDEPAPILAEDIPEVAAELARASFQSAGTYEELLEYLKALDDDWYEMVSRLEEASELAGRVLLLSGSDQARREIVRLAVLGVKDLVVGEISKQKQLSQLQHKLTLLRDAILFERDRWNLWNLPDEIATYRSFVPEDLRSDDPELIASKGFQALTLSPSGSFQTVTTGKARELERLASVFNEKAIAWASSLVGDALHVESPLAPNTLLLQIAVMLQSRWVTSTQLATDLELRPEHPDIPDQVHGERVPRSVLRLLDPVEDEKDRYFITKAMLTDADARYLALVAFPPPLLLSHPSSPSPRPP